MSLITFVGNKTSGCMLGDSATVAADDKRDIETGFQKVFSNQNIIAGVTGYTILAKIVKKLIEKKENELFLYFYLDLLIAIEHLQDKAGKELDGINYILLYDVKKRKAIILKLNLYKKTLLETTEKMGDDNVVFVLTPSDVLENDNIFEEALLQKGSAPVDEVSIAKQVLAMDFVEHSSLMIKKPYYGVRYYNNELLSVIVR